MAMLTVRNLPDEVHRALRVRAARNGRSTEAEVRDILAKIVQPKFFLGDFLADSSQKIGLKNEDVEIFNQAINKTPAEPMIFE